MSTERKAMKIIGFVMAAMGLYSLVATIASIPDIVGGNHGTGLLVATGLNVIAIVIDALICFHGIRGANTPSKARPFATFCAVGVIYDIGSTIPCFVDPATFGTPTAAWIALDVADLAVLVAGVILGRKVFEKSLG
ncbi:MAG: hypothetical protein LKE37_00550 [Atopobiaceae bacterium]|jgi:hypothetical protein|nr:hypothetical protein [Atopobiaceae bacterium]